MAKKDKKSKKPKSDREASLPIADGDPEEDAQRLVSEVGALIYAAKGFDPASLSSLPSDSPVPTVTRYVARSALLERDLLMEDELRTLSVAEATELAVTKVLSPHGCPEER